MVVDFLKKWGFTVICALICFIGIICVSIICPVKYFDINLFGEIISIISGIVGAASAIIAICRD